jgi:hypothetical protein
MSSAEGDETMAISPTLPSPTKKTRLPSWNTASQSVGATGPRTPDPLLANYIIVTLPRHVMSSLPHHKAIPFLLALVALADPL